MSAVLDIDRSGERTRGRLALNPNPQRKYWFDPPAPRNSVEAERRHRQERLAGAFRLFARFGFAQGLAGHITARDPAAIRFSLSVRPVLAETEEAAWARAGAILARIHELRGGRFGGGSAKPESIGSRRLLDAAAAGAVRDKRLWTEVAAAVGAGANTTALVGTPEQVAEALAEYHRLGVTTFLIRGFDPLEDALEYGRDLIPLVRAATAGRATTRALGVA